jgi:hypothetical protein
MALTIFLQIEQFVSKSFITQVGKYYALIFFCYSGGQMTFVWTTECDMHRDWLYFDELYFHCGQHHQDDDDNKPLYHNRFDCLLGFLLHLILVGLATAEYVK